MLIKLPSLLMFAHDKKQNWIPEFSKTKTKASRNLMMKKNRNSGNFNSLIIPQVIST